MKENNNKIKGRTDIELLRVFAMSSIILGHCFAFYGHWETPLKEIVSNTHFLFRGINPFFIYWALPLFVGISGYLIGYRQIYTKTTFCYKRFMIKKVKRLYLPAVLFSFFYIILFYRSIFSFYDWWIPVFIHGVGHLWFLYMLFCVYLISFFYYRISKKIGGSVSLVISALISIASCFFPLETSVFTSFFYQFFFFLGLQIGEKHKIKAKHGKSFKELLGKIFLYSFIYIICFIVLSAIKEMQVISTFSIESKNIAQFQHWFFRFLIGFISLNMILDLLPFNIKLNHRLIKLSSLSYKIYIIHQFFLLGIFSFPKQTLENLYLQLNFSFPVILFFVVFLLSALLALILSKITIINRMI